MVNYDLVGVLYTQARVELDFFHKADGQAGGWVGNDVTFSNYVRNILVSCDKTSGERESSPCELVFTLDLYSLHSVAVGLAILCAQRWILVSLRSCRYCRRVE